MTWNIFNEDAIKWAKEYEGEKFHALFTDAPYHLSSIVKRFGGKNSVPAKFGTDEVFSRSGKGFMGQQWDGGDVAFQPETWNAFMGVMYPGAFGMAFSASRNWHRMAVAIEDAGFVIHPTMFFLWVQGQGFPKATKVRAEGFGGYKYGLQALKPAVEPIIVFQKPYEGRPIENITQTGAGVLNIDGGRIPLQDNDEYTINEFEDGMKPFGNGAGHAYKSKKISLRRNSRGGENGLVGTSTFKIRERRAEDTEEPIGRYPANLVLDEVSASLLDFNTDEVSRFFNVVQSRIDKADPFYYCAKVNQKERSAGLNEKNPHPTLKPISLAKHLATLLLPPAQYSPRRVFVPFSGVGSEMIGACLAGWDEVVGVEFDKDNGYIDIAKKRLEHWVK